MGKKMAMYYGDKRNNGQYDNGVWMDIFKIPFLAEIDEARDYDIIIRTLWLQQTGWSEQIRRRFPNIIQIGLSDHPLSTHVSKMSPMEQLAYIKDLEHTDGIMALTEEERQWYQIALPSKPVIKAGLPFPFEQAEKDFGSFIGSEKKFIGLGVGASDNDRNFVSSFLVFQRLKLDYPDLLGVFLSLPSYQITPTAIYADACEGIYLHEREGMGAFYDILSQCKFVINLADRNTPGRIQGEAAFFEVPVIGSNRLELQNELFPDLATTPYSLEDAYKKAKLLIDNPTLATEYGQVGKRRLKRYSYQNSRKKFNDLLKRIEGD